MIDALLREHARKGAEDDDAFLQSLEERLDEEDKVISMSSIEHHGADRANKLSRALGLGLKVAAGLTVAAVGFYGWQQSLQKEKTALATHEAENPLERRAAGKVAPGKVQQEVMTKVPDADSVSVQAKKDGRMSEEALGRKLEGAPAIDSSSPSSSMARVLAANSSSKVKVAAPSVAAPAELYDFADGDDLGQALEADVRLPGRKEVGAPAIRQQANRYGALVDNGFKSPWKDPLSTFSVDVDTASYTNIRRMIQEGRSVPADAVRIEEMINYFSYSYPQPEGEHPFSVNVETASCPWNSEHRLVKVGLQGKDIAKTERPAANLVFLLDVSGSMNNQDKLPLLVDSMKILLKELNADDSVSIVVYAGAQGLALPPTHVNDEGRKTILDKLNNFRSGGSTNGGAGIELAYKMAKKHFVKGGVNRVILGTDGDFNVGVVGTDALVNMVEREAKSGVFLSVLGFGQGNLNDAMLEKITNKGNGNYFYIDSLREGRKVFLDDMMGTMVTIAKDVKIQIEFNPAKVKSYRLIGYANRMLKAEDFRDKRVDAGEIGAGHTVTALYEVVPGNAAEQVPAVDDLKYQKGKKAPKPAERDLVESPEMLTVKLAYKQPEATKETESTYFDTAVVDDDKNWQQSSDDFKFASGVALFGMLQRQSEHAGQGSYELVRQLAEQGRGDDAKGLRTEFSDLVRKVK